MFRGECRAGSEIGRTACALLSQGALVGDEIVNQVVASRIARPDCADGFLLDGYPRTVAQAVAFAGLIRDRHLPEPAIVHLDVPDELLILRLTARRQCPRCGRLYNVLSMPPRVEGLCDADAAPLVTREDDREDVIRGRLRTYRDQTRPVLNWYRSSRVHLVDGSMPPDRVARAVAKAVIDASLAAAGGQ